MPAFPKKLLLPLPTGVHERLDVMSMRRFIAVMIVGGSQRYEDFMNHYGPTYRPMEDSPKYGHTDLK